MNTCRAAGIIVVGLVSLFTGLLHAEEPLRIHGAGTTFLLPLYSSLFETVSNQRKIEIRYEGVGSADGIRALIKRRVDFAAIDAIMTPAELAEAGATVVQIPICLGAVVLSYNLPGDIPIRMSAMVISDIFLGLIRNWRDPRISQLNPSICIPDLPIQVIYRSHSCCTTAIFTRYLSSVNPEWKQKVGWGRSVTWPMGEGVNGSHEVAGLINRTMGAVGYLELTHAQWNNMKVAEVQNRAGRFVKASVESVGLAGDLKIPEGTNLTPCETDALGGYPISGFTWIAVYQHQDYNNRSERAARELVHLLWWMTHEGQALTRLMQSAPLPPEAVLKSELLLKSIQFEGRAVLTP